MIMILTKSLKTITKEKKKKKEKRKSRKKKAKKEQTKKKNSIFFDITNTSRTSFGDSALWVGGEGKGEEGINS